MGSNSKLRSAWPIACSLAALLTCGPFDGWLSKPALAQPIQPSSLDLKPLEVPGIIRMPIGVTRAGTPIQAFITEDDLNVHTKKVRLLIVAGLDGSPHSAASAVSVMHRFTTDPLFAPLRKSMALSVVPTGNPDGLARGLRNDNAAGGDPVRGYPPAGEAYLSPTNPEAHYLWRWIGMHAPDMVIELAEGRVNEYVSNSSRPVDSLTRQLTTVPPCNVGIVDASCWSVPPGNLSPFSELTEGLLADVASGSVEPDQPDLSQARLELQARDKRSALEVCQQLSKVYGHELPSVAYIPAVACIGRLRLAKLTGDSTAVADIERIAADYTSDTKPSLTESSNGSVIAGHILWGELYDATQNRELIKLSLRAADRAFNAEGQPLDAMPTHNEMSDAVFMGCPILAQAGRLTGNRKYFEMCLKHMRFMVALNRRSDGLHRHSPLDETAWGRGNGFPALGLALALADMPADAPGREEMVAVFRAHLTALLPHQDPTGAWHQVIDHPESYRELTATCMITYAMARGVREGWLDKAKFAPAIRRGWTAIKARVAADGTLVDVCTGTGKMKSLREYYDRTAILGRDPRGGAMALLVATEMVAWESPTK